MIYSNHYLYHHGIKGQRWGVRRFQNKDGTLTAAGRRRAEGAREDAASYKYNKPGESDRKGLKKAVKPKVDNKKTSSNIKNKKKSSTKKKSTLKTFSEGMHDEHVRRMKTQAKISAATGLSSVATAAATSAGVKFLAKRGYTQAASTLYTKGTDTTQRLKTASGMAAVNAGFNYLESQWWK